MYTIDLENKGNAQALINLLDIALRAKGTEAAQAVIYFNLKIKAVIEASEPKIEVEETQEIAPNMEVVDKTE